MGLLDALNFTPQSGNPLMELLRRMQGPGNGFDGVPSDRAQYSAPPATQQAVAQPSPLDAAQWPFGPVGAPSQAMAMAAPAPQQVAPVPQPAPQISSPGVGSNLMAGVQSFAGSGALGPALINGLSGLMTGRRADPAGVQEQKVSQAQNMTAQALVQKGVDPQIAAASVGNPELQKALIAQHFGTKQVQDIGNGYIVRDGQVVKAYDKTAAGGTEYGLNPIYGKDEKGNDVLGTIGKDGSFKKIDTGGVTLNSGVDKIDLGTHYQLRDKRSGAIIATEKKDIAGARREGEIGESQGKSIAAAPGDIQSGQNALDLIAKIKSHPYLDRGTGFSAYGNIIPGTGGYDFQNLVEQSKSGAFLTAIQQMRGLGQLSNTEGQTATAAVNRMNTATSKEAFLEAVNDYERVINQGITSAQKKITTSPANPSSAPSVDDLLKKYGGS